MPYPDRLEDVERLIKQHEKIAHQKLLLAIYLDHPEDPDSVYLLEVISQLGYDEIDDDRDLFVMSYGSTEGFRVPSGSRLDIMLTNAVELDAAIEQEWLSLNPVLAAVQAGPGHYRVIYSSGVGDTLVSHLQRDLVLA